MKGKLNLPIALFIVAFLSISLGYLAFLVSSKDTRKSLAPESASRKPLLEVKQEPRRGLAGPTVSFGTEDIAEQNEVIAAPPQKALTDYDEKGVEKHRQPNLHRLLPDAIPNNVIGDNLSPTDIIADETQDQYPEPPVHGHVGYNARRGEVPSIQAVEAEHIEPRFRAADDGPGLRPNHPPIDQLPPIPMPYPEDRPGAGPGVPVEHNAVTSETVTLPTDMVK